MVDMGKLLILLGLIGLTMILVRGTIFYNFREWLLVVRPNDIGYIFTCPQCMGFWVGLFGGGFYDNILFIPLYAGAVSLFASMVDAWMLTLHPAEVETNETHRQFDVIEYGDIRQNLPIGSYG